ncbi:hypothetical protein AgCh_021720 [Apium graveolens]
MKIAERIHDTMEKVAALEKLTQWCMSHLQGVIRPGVSPWVAPVLFMEKKDEKLIKDYDYSINYHPCKDNIVADALSKKERLNAIRIAEELARELEKLEIEVRVP